MKTFKDGTVWDVSFVKTKANMGVEYLNSLKSNWTKVYDEAIKQGLVVSYKILAGEAANPEDWDIMLMVEYKNLASMEGNDDKWEAIAKTVMGGEEAMKSTNQKRVDVREIYGSKVLREVVYK
jgi:hypothetical protein